MYIYIYMRYLHGRILQYAVCIHSIFHHSVMSIPIFIVAVVVYILLYSLPFVKKYSCNVTMKANEDFGVIRLDKTTLKCHLPNEVDAALKLLESEMNSETSGNEYYDLGFDYEESFL